MAVPAERRTGAAQRAVQQMVKALEAEITATRRRRDSDWKAIGTGERVARAPTDATYAFRNAGFTSYRAGTELRLQADGSTTMARVLAHRDGTLTLACAEDLGPETGPARVYRDPSWLLVEQQRALRSLGTVPHLANLLLRPKSARVATVAEKFVDRRALADLNPEQSAAVRQAAGSEVCFLWGPPGSGKTQTLARVTEALFRRGESVLLVAPTNQAVDHLLLATAERLDDEPALENGEVLRLGPIGSGELRRRYGRNVDLDRVVRPAAAERAEEQERAIREVLAHVEGVDHPVDRTSFELKRQLRRDLNRLRERAAHRETKAEGFQRELLADARLVATTLHRACVGGQLDRLFDVVVIDEASMAGFPLVFLAAALRARKRVIVGGDFRQLPPVVESRDAMARRWLGRDPFEVAGLADAVEEGETPGVLARLVQQYRMHPTICQVVSRYAYGGDLATAPSRARQSLNHCRLIDEHRVQLIDTSSFPTRLAPGDRTRANPLHGLVIARLLADLLEDGEEGATGLDVAVLSPYRDQVAAHRERFGASFAASILTVHEAQGQEWDVVIVDLPSASGVRPSPFARARDLKEDGARLNNVAASRAREQLLVVADVDYYADHGLGDSCVGKLLSLVKKEGPQLEWHQVVSSLSRGV